MSLYEEFNSLGNDLERWCWLMDNQDGEITVMCDNDDTFVYFPQEEATCSFDDYIGWSGGVFALMGAVGIRAEMV